jgi:hypothetical protein
MRSFFTLSAAMGFVVMGADCTNAYANTPWPTQPTHVRIDDAYTYWYHSRYGKEIDRSLVLLVLKALQENPEAVTLWKKRINKILDDLDIVCTTHERSIYRGPIDEKVVLLCRQVDGIKLAPSIVCDQHSERSDQDIRLGSSPPTRPPHYEHRPCTI